MSAPDTSTLASQRLAILGCGSLGESLLRGLLATGQPAAQLRASSRRAERRAELSQRHGIATLADNRTAAASADILLLAVKPAQIAGLCTELAGLDLRNKLIISVAAGIPTTQIRAALAAGTDASGTDARSTDAGTTALAIVRAMPNTPSAIGAGACGLYAAPGVSAGQRRLAEQIFTAVGVWAWLADEALMDAVTAVAGSGPAYYFAILEAMQAAAEKLGLPADTARLLVKQTCLGAAQLASEGGAPDFAALRVAVTSPGGTTAAALKVFAARDLAGTIDAALVAAVARGREMADQATKT